MQETQDWSLLDRLRCRLDAALGRYARAYISEDWEDLYDFESSTMYCFFLSDDDDE